MIERIRYGGVNNPYNYSEFVCDTVVDLADLPTTVSVDKYKKFDTCSIGSKATVISDKTTYILNSNNQWIMLNDYKTYNECIGEMSSIRDEVRTLKEQIDDGVNPEVTQARVDANGTTYETLKERLDSTDENVESVSTELKEDLANGNVGNNTISEEKTTFFEFVRKNYIDTYPTESGDENLTISIDENYIYTINGKASNNIVLTLAESIENGDYVVLTDNHNYNGQYVSLLFSVPVINTYGKKTSRSLIVNLTNTIYRKEISAIAEEIVSPTDTIDGDMKILLLINTSAYDNFKTRFWVVKKGYDEEFLFGTEYKLKDYIKSDEVYTKDEVDRKIIGDCSLRFAVATDIHFNKDDSANTGLDGDAKTQLLVDSVNAEHHNKPLDFLMITGDVLEGGGETELKRFKNQFLYQFEMPVVLFAGNHDGIKSDKWKSITGYNRQTSLETNDFYFIYADNFGDHLGNTWLSHWSAYYEDGDTQAYIKCDSSDDGALLVGTDIAISEVTPIMKGWDLSLSDGDYVKLEYAKKCRHV